MSLKNIKVTEEVKEQLDDYAYDKETYNVTIQRLLNENRALSHEKQSFMDTIQILTNIVNNQDARLKELDGEDSSDDE